MAYLSVRHDQRSGYRISYGGRSRGWEPPGFLRITAVLMVNGHRVDSVSGNTRYGRSVETSRGTYYGRFMRFATVSVRAFGRAGSVSCRTMRR